MIRQYRGWLLGVAAFLWVGLPEAPSVTLAHAVPQSKTVPQSKQSKAVPKSKTSSQSKSAKTSKVATTGKAAPKAAPKSSTKTAKKTATKKTTTKKTTASTSPRPVYVPSCKATLVMDYQTGQVLHADNAYTLQRPASVTKLMVSWVVYTEVERGRIGWNDMVTVSRRAAATGGSQVYLKAGERFTVRELLNALLIESGNDAGVALAEYVGGSVERFVAMMNREAKNLGLRGAEFHSPHGLPPEKGGQPDLISAYEVALLSRALLDRYPEVLDITALKTVSFRQGKMKLSNHNKLLWNFAGCDGLKTGFYRLAGFSISATAERNGRRMIAVVMGCDNRFYRDKETARLLAAGFSMNQGYAANGERPLRPELLAQRLVKPVSAP